MVRPRPGDPGTGVSTALAPESSPESQPLFHSDRGLYSFQEDGIARCYLEMENGGGVLCTWDTGMGKSILAMGLAALLFEDDLIDHVLLVAERQKITDDEWPKDWARFTRLSWARHHGPGRMERLKKNGLPQVLITSYETGKTDLGKFDSPPNKRGKVIVPGPLLELLLGKRVLVVFDESGKLRNRSSDNYKVWFDVLKRLRKAGTTRVLGMSATPIEKDYEDAFNQLRLIHPPAMPLVKEFEEYFVKSRDPWGRARYYPARMPEFAQIARPMILSKRKTDPDVIAEFPKQVEEARWFEMAEDQQALYERLCDLQIPDDPNEELLTVPGLQTLKRMACAHPMSIVHSAYHGSSQVAQLLVEEWGVDYFKSVSSVKEQGLIDYLEPLVHGQGAKVVVFSFFGPSVLPILKTSLEKKKFKVYLTYGGMSMDEVSRERQAFKDDPRPAVLLSSDAGAKGVNLPQATYCVEYESALTFANRTQRINRIHRIDSMAPSVTCMTFFVKHSVEAAIAQTMIERNSQHDVLLLDDDAGEDYITAAERRVSLEIYRNTRRRKRHARS